MLIPNRTLGDLFVNLAALALGIASHPVSIVLLVIVLICWGLL
jgi:hypothetical protein